nr:MAG TPA: hypothetical protein [Caudoviricetes sp.]
MYVLGRLRGGFSPCPARRWCDSISQHNTPEAGAGIMQFLLRLHSKTSMVISFLSNLGWVDSALRLQIERGTPLDDVQQAATYARAGAER